MRPIKIPVTFDKSHIITIGKKLYFKSIDLIRELVNNSYDADATEVRVTLTNDKIIVEDNGYGMDRDGFIQYFKIGSREKAVNNISPRFQRKRIGELGIGKFSSLGAATKFEVISRKGEYYGRVVFDQKEWDKKETDWSVPIEESRNETGANGTKIILYDVQQHYSPQEVADRLRTSVPLESNNFKVIINETEVKPVFLQGKRIKIFSATKFGDISGMIILTEKPQKFEFAGVECRVKGVMIMKTLFGYEGFGHGVNRIAGSVNADFLPFNSARDNFLVDTEEYRVFYKTMRDELSKVMKELKAKEDEKIVKQSAEALQKASKLVEKALKARPDLTPIINVPISKSHTDAAKYQDEESSLIKRGRKKNIHRVTKPKNKRGENKIPHINPITENKILKKIKSDFGG